MVERVHPSLPQAISRPHDTVLIVDDNRDLLEAARDLLTQSIAGLRILVAPNADEALKTLAGQPVDVIVTDFKMPGADGIQFLCAARDIQPSAEGILMSGFLDPRMADDALHKAGVAEMLHKPYDPAEFVYAVQTRLFRHRMYQPHATHFALRAQA